MPFPHALLSDNYVPPTGFGGFRIEYQPAVPRLAVKVKVFWEWESVGDAAWTDEAQANYRARFEQEVPRAWNGKWKLACSREGFRTEVGPEFQIQTVNHERQANFKFKVRNVHGQSFLHATQKYVQLHINDLEAYSDFQPGGAGGASVQGVMLDERRKVEAILAPVQNIQLARTPTGGWEVAPASRIALTTFAQQLQRVHHLAPRFPLTVHTSSGLREKGRAMATAVNTFLRANGVTTYPIETDPVKTGRKLKAPWTPHKTTASATITLSDDYAEVGRTFDYRYKVAQHEFGHCLGLPDEYTTYPNGSPIADSHQKWVGVCQRAGVPPNAYPVNNLSMMSCGFVTNACHFVTVWDALIRTTFMYVRPREWRIVRGSEVDAL
jgi:hypothetical protein